MNSPIDVSDDATTPLILGLSELSFLIGSLDREIATFLTELLVLPSPGQEEQTFVRSVVESLAMRGLASIKEDDLALSGPVAGLVAILGRARGGTSVGMVGNGTSSILRIARSELGSVVFSPISLAGYKIGVLDPGADLAEMVLDIAAARAQEGGQTTPLEVVVSPASGAGGGAGVQRFTLRDGSAGEVEALQLEVGPGLRAALSEPWTP
ncbi:MAG: hypothetical protein ABI239_03725 [Aquihabitans sp.]